MATALTTALYPNRSSTGARLTCEAAIGGIAACRSRRHIGDILRSRRPADRASDAWRFMRDGSAPVTAHAGYRSNYLAFLQIKARIGSATPIRPDFVK
jgi:hypothetical protein